MCLLADFPALCLARSVGDAHELQQWRLWRLVVVPSEMMSQAFQRLGNERLWAGVSVSHSSYSSGGSGGGWVVVARLSRTI